LREIGAGFPKGQKTLASSLGGLKMGILTIETDHIVLEQRLGIAAGVLIGLMSLILVGVVVALMFASNSDPQKFDRSHSPGPLALLVWPVILIPPWLIALWVRRFRHQFLLADVIQAELRGREVELRFRPPTAQAKPVAGAPSPSMVQFEFAPLEPGRLPLLATKLSAAGVELSDPHRAEKADFLQRLNAATPKAWMTRLLIALNVIAFLALAFDGETILGFQPSELIKWGGNFGPLTVNCHQWWRLLACCFLHIGILHLLFNMYALLLAGILSERLFGNWYFLLIYLGCGLAASMASIWFNPAVVSVGASGAIFGVYGALLGYDAREGAGLPRSLVKPVAQSCLVFIGWNLIYGFLSTLNHAAGHIIDSVNHARSGGPTIDMAAHVGGLVAGLVFGFLGARPLELAPRRSSTPARALALATAIASILALLFVPMLRANPANLERMKLLGGLYSRGEGVGKDSAAAVKWFSLAAEQGDLNSQLLLASMYYRGDGVAKDVPSAAQCFAKAAEQGDINAQKTLAGIYLRGEGVPTNKTEGLKWLIKVGNQGDIEVQKMLAAAYVKGDGVEKNMAEAINWARKVAQQGDLKYEVMLAAIYADGDGVERNRSEAANWYRLAAGQGATNAQRAFGLMCANGDGIESNPVEALKWLTLSGDTSVEVAKVRQVLESEMSAQQIQDVDRVVQKFLQLRPRR
jgi:TPR repeat protein